MPKGNTVVIVLLSMIVGGMTWSYAQQSRSTVLMPQDYNEITQLYARYAFAIDSVNAEAFTALFTDDGAFNNVVGHDALANFINVNVAKDVAATQRRHWNSNLVITGTAEGAKGACYLLAVSVIARPPTLIGASKYDDTLVKTPQGWRFKKRIVIGDGPPRAAAPANPARPQQ